MTVQDLVQLFLELELIEGKEAAFEAAFQEISQIVRHHDIALRYNFYRDPKKASTIYAIETYRDVAALSRYFEVAMPALEKARACARPVRIMVFGNLPPALKSMLERDGAAVTPAWLSN